MNLSYMKFCANLGLFFANLFQQSTATFGLYGQNDGIEILTDKNFDRVIMKSSDVWIVEYFAPWCPYCLNFVPEMQKLGRMKDTFRVAAIDADKNNIIRDRYSITGFPTIKIFGKNKLASPIHYDGNLKAKSIAAAAKKLTQVTNSV